jgi:hypothetical protein
VEAALFGIENFEFLPLSSCFLDLTARRTEGHVRQMSFWARVCSAYYKAFYPTLAFGGQAYDLWPLISELLAISPWNEMNMGT